MTMSLEFRAPPIANLLTDIGMFGRFADARHPAAIAMGWNDIRGRVPDYGVSGDEECPDAYDQAHVFKDGKVGELRVRLHPAIIIRASQISEETVNGNGNVIDSIPDIAKAGLFGPYARDVLVESASLVLGNKSDAPITSLADLLRAAISYLTDDDAPSEETIVTLADAFEHHGITKDMLASSLEDGRQAILSRMPEISTELERRLMRIVSNVASSEALYDGYHITERLIEESRQVGLIPVPAARGALRILWDRDEIERSAAYKAAINRGGGILSAVIGGVSLFLCLYHIREIPPAEAKALLKISGIFGALAVYNFVKLYLARLR